MKGSIFKHFESFVLDNWGEAFFEEILDSVSLKTKGPFLGPDNYPDEDLLAIVGTTITKLGLPLPTALRVFGKYLFEKLAGDAPQALAGRTEIKDFLMSIDSSIHVEVKKLSPEAYLPRLVSEDVGEKELVMHYHSRRQFCQLFLGLVEGASLRFHSSVVCEETACTHKGDDHCTFHFQFRDVA